MIRKLLPYLPVAGFAATLALMQWISGMPVTRLWIHTLLVALAVGLAVRFIPWDRWLFRLRAGSFLFEASLFALFVRHFAWMFLAEARRALIARRMIAPVSYAPGWWSSVVFSVASFFGRALTRTERFYASLVVRGVGL